MIDELELRILVAGRIAAGLSVNKHWSAETVAKESLAVADGIVRGAKAQMQRDQESRTRVAPAPMLPPPPPHKGSSG